MRHRRPRRRGDWARRLAADSPISSDSEIFPCDSSCSSDSFSSHDMYAAINPSARTPYPLSNYSALPPPRTAPVPHLSDLSLTSSDHVPVRRPPLLDIRDVSLSEYAAAELPDLAIFFRGFLPPTGSPSHPRYSQRPSRMVRSMPDISHSHSAIPRSPRYGKDPSKRCLPPTFPDKSRQHPLRRDSPNDTELASVKLPLLPIDSSSPDQYAPRAPRHRRSHRTPTFDPATVGYEAPIHHYSSDLDRSLPVRSSSFPRDNSELRRKSPRKDRSPSHRVLTETPSTPRRSSRSARASSANSPKKITTRRYAEDIDGSAVAQRQQYETTDPDSLSHFFLLEKMVRWYSDVFVITGERLFRVRLR